MDKEKDIIFNKKPANSMNKDTDLLSKAEKLAAAIYMVTSFIPENEPIRRKLRLSSISLISNISLADMTADTGESLNIISKRVTEALSLIKIAGTVNLISEMNFSILKTEYNDFLNRLSGVGSGIRSPVIEKEFFSHRAPPNIKGTFSKGQIAIKDTQKLHIGQRTDKGHNTEEKRTFSGNNSNRTSRREEILKLAGEMKEITIKDISSHISGISGKTLQRELLFLVASGELKKEGEKRWSRYSLIR